MSAVNKGLDQRAYAAEQRTAYRSTADITRIHDLEKNLEQIARDRGEDEQLLCGLTRLVKAGRYDRATDTLTLSTLDLHSDPAVAHVWRLVRQHKLGEK